MASRTDGDRARKAALSSALREMFAKLRGRAVPDRLMSVVDQLDGAEDPPLKKVRRG